MIYTTCVLTVLLHLKHGYGDPLSFYTDGLEKFAGVIKTKGNTSWVQVPYPSEPLCSLTKTQKEPPIAVSLSIWKVDLNNEGIEAFIYWREHKEVECVSYFFGDITPILTSTETSLYEGSLSKMNITTLSMTALGYPVVLFTEGPNYVCSWMRTTISSISQVIGVRSRVVVGMDGTILQPLGNWRKIKAGTYTDGSKTLIWTGSDRPAACPFKIYQTHSALISYEIKDPSIIVSPDHKILLSLKSSWGPAVCVKTGNIPIFKTQGGYLISLADPYGRVLRAPSDLKTNTRPIESGFKDPYVYHRMKRNLPDANFEQLLRLLTVQDLKKTKRSVDNMTTEFLVSDYFDPSMRLNFNYAQYRYDMNSLIHQDEGAKKSLMNLICHIKSLQWTMLSPPDLATKVAVYLSGDSSTFGERRNGHFYIMTPSSLKDPVTLKNPLQVKNGMFQVYFNSNETKELWLEPILGRLFEHPTVTPMSMRSSWIPLVGGGRYFPKTKIHLPSESGIPDLLFPPIITASTHEKIYDAGEVDNVHWNKRVIGLSSADPMWIQPSWWTTLTSYGIHLLIGIVISLFFLFCFPIFLQCCCSTGKAVSKEMSSLLRVR